MKRKGYFKSWRMNCEILGPDRLIRLFVYLPNPYALKFPFIYSSLLFQISTIQLYTEEIFIKNRTMESLNLLLSKTE